MPKPLQSVFYRILIPAPFVLAIWILVAWIIFQQSVGGFLSLFLAIPAAFIQLAILGFMLWLRPSIRLSREFTTEDALWYFATFLAWAVGAALVNPWGGLVQIAGFVLGIIGMSRIGKRSHTEAVETMTQRAEQMRQHLGDQRTGPWPDASGPGAGKVIIVDTDTEWEDRGPASNSARKPIEGEIIEDPKDEDPDVDEWQARPHSD
ncbi:MAG: hypothetical protein ACTHXA_12790 [Gulosibacter sp.]|uniref:hypothetical protein n=1 Tax=Gulosibacter sp. TaxID=2817531 RepID=UPI003F8DF62F